MTAIANIKSGFDYEIDYYLSGPMAGYPENNFPLFEQTTWELRDDGISVESPHEVKHEHLDGKPEQWGEYLRGDLLMMLERCRGIILIDGWAQSKGAMLELHVAMSLGWPVWFYDTRQKVLHNMNRRTAT